MLWRKLIPVSLGCAFIVVGGLATTAPSSASATTLDCGKHDGNVCRRTCTTTDDEGRCTDWSEKHYPK
jgi:hypothetical protein